MHIFVFIDCCADVCTYVAELRQFRIYIAAFYCYIVTVIITYSVVIYTAALSSGDSGLENLEGHDCGDRVGVPLICWARAIVPPVRG